MSTKILWGVALAALFGLIILALGSGVGEPPAVRDAPADTATTAAETRTDAVAEASAEGGFILRNVRLFDGERVWPVADVEVVAGLVRRVAESLPDSDDVQAEIDGSGMTLLPGLIDSHVHTWGGARAEALVFGVTTVFDMFSLPDVLPHARQQRESVVPTREADLFGAGYLATVDGGHGTQYGLAVPTLASPEQASEWVAARKAEGSDFIKLVREDMSSYRDGDPQPSLDRATAAAVIAAARAEGLLAVVHVSTLQHAMESLQDGAHGLVHIFHDMPADQAFVDLALDTGAFVIPTLTVIAGIAREPSGVLDDARLAPWIPATAKGTLAARFGRAESGASGVAHARTSVGRLHEAGVPILAGSDAPNPNTAHGVSMHEELAQLVRAGLSSEAALASATSVAADAFALKDRGRIAPGLRADLLLVRGDPLADIEATRDIVTIWKNGQPVERPRADAQVVPAAAALNAGSLGDFDQVADVAAGSDGWMPTTDQMAGGASEVQLERVAPGAGDSAGTLRISGEIASAGGQRWAGAMHSPGPEMMQPRDASALTELVLHVRGDGRSYAALLFSGAEMQAVPSVQTFVAEGQWQPVTLPLSGFTGADLKTLRAIAITATDPPGSFWLEVDQIGLQ